MSRSRYAAYALVGIVAFPLWLVPQLVVLLAVLSLTGVVHGYRIPSSSMEPTLRCAGHFGCTGSENDRVVGLRYLFGSPGRGDVVVFRTPTAAIERCGAGGLFVKRVVGLPGERWRERSGYVYVDGRRLREPYVDPARRDTESYPPATIPAGRYLLLGDNRSSSCDSRVFGSVARRAIVARIVLRYWPPSRFGLG